MNERVSNVIHHPAFVPVLTGASAFAVGVGLGFFLGRRQMTKVEEYEIKDEYIIDVDVDVDSAFEKAKIMKEFKEEEVIVERPPRVVIDAERLEKAQGFITEILEPETNSEETHLELVPQPEPEPEAEPEIKNVFANDDDTWNYEEEKKHRSKDRPYVLHKDEFYDEEMADEGYTQSTLTYYAGDDILVDEDNKPIYNYSQIIGDLKFGHGSGDPNVFYVRNDKRNGEYEIIVDSGLYSVEVLGLEIENNARVQDLKHSHSPRRFRPD